MAERLALGIIPGVGWRAREIQTIGGAALSDRLLDAVCLLGPLARCREQLAAFRSAGTDLPILMPSVDVNGAHTLIKAFAR